MLLLPMSRQLPCRTQYDSGSTVRVLCRKLDAKFPKQSPPKKNTQHTHTACAAEVERYGACQRAASRQGNAARWGNTSSFSTRQRRTVGQHEQLLDKATPHGGATRAASRQGNAARWGNTSSFSTRQRRTVGQHEQLLDKATPHGGATRMRWKSNAAASISSHSARC